MPIIEATSRSKWFIGEYDFAVDGGAVGTINLRGYGQLGSLVPAGCIIADAWIDVLTTVTSGGAPTIAGQLEAAGDVFAATAFGSFTAGRKNALPTGVSASVSAGAQIKTTVARQIAIVIAAAALTAGKFRVGVLAV